MILRVEGRIDWKKEIEAKAGTGRYGLPRQINMYITRIVIDIFQADSWFQQIQHYKTAKTSESTI